MFFKNIVDSIQDHHRIDIDSIKSRIAEWLRRCGDRLSNELKKQMKKAQNSSTNPVS